MGFFDSMQEAVEKKQKTIARRATDTGLVRQILELQQKIDDGDGDGGTESWLRVLKDEADRRRLYY